MMQLSIQAGTLKAPIAFERYTDSRFVKAVQPVRIAL
jgi:NitT/TauT family transport system substrate-binding protein